MGFLDETLDNIGKPMGAAGFTPGAHTVKIGLAEAGISGKDAKGNDREVIKVIVIGENDEEGEATLWLHTEGGAKMAVTKVLGILVHNVKEDKKATISDFGKRVFANVQTPADTKDHLLKILNEKLIGKEAFIYAEPQEKYDTTKYVDLWHYEQSGRAPSAREDAITDKKADSIVIEDLDGEKVDPSEVPKNLFD
jgi:hypothetical protein